MAPVSPEIEKTTAMLSTAFPLLLGALSVIVWAKPSWPMAKNRPNTSRRNQLPDTLPDGVIRAVSWACDSGRTTVGAEAKSGKRSQGCEVIAPMMLVRGCRADTTAERLARLMGRRKRTKEVSMWRRERSFHIVTVGEQLRRKFFRHLPSAPFGFLEPVLMHRLHPTRHAGKVGGESAD